MQNKVQLKALHKSATQREKIVPPFSITTRFINPEKIMANPAPTNQSVSGSKCKGKAKLICTVPNRTTRTDIIFIILCNNIHPFALAGI
jgi:hypothetical protein